MDITALAIQPYDWPQNLLDDARGVDDLCTEPVIALLRHAALVTMKAAWEEGQAAILTGWLMAASATYEEAAGLLEARTEDPDACLNRQVYAIIYAADSCAAMGGWGHLRVVRLVQHLPLEAPVMMDPRREQRSTEHVTVVPADVYDAMTQGD